MISEPTPLTQPARAPNGQAWDDYLKLGFGPFSMASLDNLPDGYVLELLKGHKRGDKKLTDLQHRYLLQRLLEWVGLD